MLFAHFRYEKRSSTKYISNLSGYDTLLSRSSAVSDIAQVRKKEKIERAPEVLLPKVGDSEQYDMFRWRACRDIDSLKAGGVRVSSIESEWRYNQQSFGDNGDGMEEYQLPFRTKVAVWDAEYFVVFSTKVCDDGGKIKCLVIWLARVDL